MKAKLKAYLETVYSESRAHDETQTERAACWRNLHPDSAALLAVLVRAKQARKVLEVGTSNGYSTLWLADAVRDRVARETGERPAGPIRLLAHPRYFGHVFNPVAFYYGYAADGTTLHTIVAEITNTPWRERHSYVLPVRDGVPYGDGWEWGFDKAFHVSPFLPMDCAYRWRFTVPDEALRVHMQVDREGRRAFDATLTLLRQPLDGRSLARVLWRHPLMTAQVMTGIHWPALRLWLKRTPVHDHPSLARETP
mgnify:CR=1 FL=1